MRVQFGGNKLGAFRVAARAVLELGAELISSDEIALYELVKNAFDAGSSDVEIKFYVSLRRTEYEPLAASLDEPIYLDEDTVSSESLTTRK